MVAMSKSSDHLFDTQTSPPEVTPRVTELRSACIFITSNIEWDFQYYGWFLHYISWLSIIYYTTRFYHKFHRHKFHSFMLKIKRQSYFYKYYRYIFCQRFVDTKGFTFYYYYLVFPKLMLVCELEKRAST